MRKRDRVESYIPLVLGAIYLWVIHYVCNKLGVPVMDYIWFIAAIWVILVAVGVNITDNILTLFEIKFDNNNEEENIDE
jgi:hypothetical protein